MQFTSPVSGFNVMGDQCTWHALALNVNATIIYAGLSAHEWHFFIISSLSS